MASILKAGLPQPAPRPTLPPIRYSAAAAAAVAPSSAVPPTPSQPQPPAVIPSNPPPAVPAAPSITASSSTADQQSGISASPSLTHPSITSPMLSSASVSHQPDGSFYSGQESPALSEAGPAATSSPQRIESRKGTFMDQVSAKMLNSLHVHLLASIDLSSPSWTQSPSAVVRCLYSFGSIEA